MQPIAHTNESCSPLQPSLHRDQPVIHSRDLLRGGNLLLIEHAGDRYYLRMTRNNKLILTK